MKQVKLLKHFAGFALRVDRFKEIANRIINTESFEQVNQTNIFLMDNQTEQFYTSADKLDIFLGAVPFSKDNTVLVTQDVEINGNTYAGLPVIDLNEGVQADYAKKDGHFFIREQAHEIYVPFNMAELDDDTKEALLADILTVIQTEYINEIQFKDSWMHTGKKDKLSGRVVEYLKRDLQEQLRHKESREKELERYIADAKQNLLRYSRDYQLLMIEVNALRNGEVQGLDKFVSGLDSIAKHPLVKDVKVYEDKVTIFTKQIVTRARVERQERFYNMGDMEISINIKNSDVRFSGKEKHKSHWTRQDPHPHVNGDSGRACLGNVEMTIAELCNQLEIYPLFLTALDFLQNANTEDVAGANVTNWNRVNEDGTPWVDEAKLERERKVKELRKAERERERQAQIEREAQRAREEQEFASMLRAQPAPQVPVSDRVNVATDVEQRIDVLKTEVDEVATYIAYDNYIGYVDNNFLEQAEEILRNGGTI